MKANNRASEQDNSHAVSSHHGGLKYVSQGNVDHRENPPKAVEKERKLIPTYVSEIESKVENLDRYFHELEEVLDHERDRRHSLEQTVSNG